jgi:thiamine-phosphate pyrophosphorylase
LNTVSSLWRMARRLERRPGGRKGLPPLWLFTDPARVKDPVAAAARLPRGAGVVYRAFGRTDAVEVGEALARVCRQRGLILLVGADPGLAARLGADGVHWPQRLARRRGLNHRLAKRFHITAAAHDLPAVLAARRAGAEALFLSPVFASRSASAGRPLGPMRLAAWARQAGLPVYALGGITVTRGRRLRLAGVDGMAAVGALIRT